MGIGSQFVRNYEELFYFFKTDMIPICIVTEKKIMGFGRLE